MLLLSRTSQSERPCYMTLRQEMRAWPASWATGHDLSVTGIQDTCTPGTNQKVLPSGLWQEGPALTSAWAAGDAKDPMAINLMVVTIFLTLQSTLLFPPLINVNPRHIFQLSCPSLCSGQQQRISKRRPQHPRTPVAIATTWCSKAKLERQKKTGGRQGLRKTRLTRQSTQWF